MTEAVWLAITLDRGGARPLAVQLQEAIRTRILDGRAAAGTRLPSTRAFAAELGVARATVVTAYEQLAAEGHIAARPGAAARVSALSIPAVPAKPASPAAPKPPSYPGAPDLRLFPHRAWARALASAWKRREPGRFEPADAGGSFRLRRAIATHLAEWRGFAPEAESVLITAGAAGAFELTLDALTGPGDGVIVEDPAYPTTRTLVEHRGRRLLPVPADAEGLETAGLPERAEAARLAVVTPSHQFPLGSMLSPRRRAVLLAWAAARGAVVVEDDYDSEFRYTGQAPPPLAVHAGGAEVVYIGSFAKIFTSGLRLGFAVPPPSLLPLFAETLRRFGARASLLAQEPLAVFIENGDFARHLRRMRRAYAERRRVFLTEMRETVGPDWLVPAEKGAGMHILMRFGPRLAAKGEADISLAARLKAAGLPVSPLSPYYAEPAAGSQGLLFGFTAATPDELRAMAIDLRSRLAEGWSSWGWCAIGSGDTA